MSTTVEGPVTKVFISYSRRDTAFVRELHVLLEAFGFDVLLDQEDIAFGEAWEPRLRSLIGSAETTVCVITEAWLASRECDKELDIALKSGRRVIPVVTSEVDHTRIPEALAKLQFVFFYGDKVTFAAGIRDLVKALRSDIGWVRQQSRYLTLATDWETASRSEALLLRGEVLAQAKRWLESPVPSDVRVLPLVAEFIKRSEGAEVAEADKKLRARLWQVGLGAVALVALLSGGLAYAWARELQVEAELSRAEAEAFASAAAYEPCYEDDYPDEEPEDGPIDEELMEASAEEAPEAPRPKAKKKARGRRPPVDLTRVEASVEQLGHSDRSTRLAAAQEVARMVRSEDPQPVLKELMRQLKPPRVHEISDTGRFNVLYVLNLAQPAELQTVQEDLKVTLADLAEVFRYQVSSSGFIQSRDCMKSLLEKLAGRAGEPSCGI